MASVTEEAETVAAAWFHDTVEDTPAIFHHMEREFGLRVTQLVRELTDISKVKVRHRITNLIPEYYN